MKRLLSALLVIIIPVALAACAHTASTATEPSMANTIAAQTATSSPIPALTPTPTPAATTVRATIPEGYSLVQICNLLAQMRVNTFENLLTSATTGDFSAYKCISAADNPANRCYQLEGYLFPDTYDFNINESPESVWGKFLTNFSKRTAAYEAAAAQIGYTMDQAITLASLIEKEAGNINEVAKISSVLHNRLDIGQKLELDASIIYVETYIKPYISGDIDRYNAYYNTYKTAALPAGPICNPGTRSLDAALHPASTNYFYFVNDAAFNYYYAATWEEHLANIQKI